MWDASHVLSEGYIASSPVLPAVQSSSLISSAIIWLSEFKTTLLNVLVASFSPVIASGTMSETSWAKKPSTNVFVSSAIKLNLAGFNCATLSRALNS